MSVNRKKVFICIIAALTVLLVTFNCGVMPIKTGIGAMKPVLLIDAGHGGIDGGAVSSSGAVEKDINLSIAIYVKQLAEKNGWRVVMTRERDVSLHKNDDASIRSRKTEDLRVRCEMLEKYQPAAAVSIHLNSFREDISVNGVQVFYPGGWDDGEHLLECKKFAEIMQKKLAEAVAADRVRTPLAKDNVFLFKEEICPIVIVECGFLSNPEEAELLLSDKYQQKLARGIMAGITEFTGVEGERNIKVIDSSEEKNND